MLEDPEQQKFLDGLTRDLFQLSIGDLRQGILDYAQKLEASQRNGFAEVFAHASGSLGYQPLASRIASGNLLEDIAGLHSRLEQGEYFDGFGWDEDIYDERSFGDESWAEELTDLFSMTSELFSTGELEKAKEAYERLFAILDLDGEIGIFSGPLCAADMLDLDLAINRTQYLRCVYELTPENTRASEVAHAWFESTDFEDAITLQDVDRCRESDLVDMDTFLPRWINELQARMQERPNSRVRKLLVEATLFSGGLDSLAELARNARVAQAELYRDWVVLVQSFGNEEVAIATAREALDILAEPGRTRAEIADILATLSSCDQSQRLMARREAFRSDPNLCRLVILHTEEAKRTNPAQSMRNEIDFFRSGRRATEISPATYLALLILAGQVEEAINVVEAIPGAGRNIEAGQKILLPFLLLSVLEKPSVLPTTGSWLAQLWTGIDQIDSFLWNLQSTDFFDSSSEVAKLDRNNDMSLAAILMERIKVEQLSEEQRAARIRAAESLIERSVVQVVGGRNRPLYASAANLITSRLEVGYLTSDQSGAEHFATMLVSRFPRHRAFQQEMKRSRQNSKILQR